MSDIRQCLLKKANSEPERTEIELTNKDANGQYSYLSSNPSGYRKWFRERMRQNMNEAVFRSFGKYASVEGVLEKVPESHLKTPLQRAIQLLKRHRDEFYFGLSEERRKNKPISMIITTLAAQAYRGEVNLKDALENILAHLVEGIQKDVDGNPAIWNPALARYKENFAEKWRDCPDKESEFNVWLCKARKDFKSIFSRQLDAQNISKIKKVLGESVSSRVFKEANLEDAGIETYPLALFSTASVYDLFRERHREAPPARMGVKGWVNITGYYESQGRYMWFPSNAMPFAKNRNLRFRAKTNVQGRYDVMWQVVNTGEEAKGKECLRGDYSGGKSGCDEKGFWHDESTAFSGTHYVACYIIQNGQCVARSAEFVVNIK